MSCPELTLSVEPGTLGGRFTTIEGLLSQVRDDLKSNIFDMQGGGGDSMGGGDKAKWTSFFDRLDAAIRGEVQFTVVLEDPLAGSYVQSLAEVEGQLDEGLRMEEYERTALEEAELGLTDMRTEGYEEDHARDVALEAAAAQKS
jgi:zinc finger protein